jgi:Zn-dependent protease
MSDGMLLVIDLIVVIFSVMVHEVSHGYAAERLGDPTARLAGRLNLNPLNHLDPVGSILVPLALHFSGAPIFGWAKPVPYNPMNLRDPVGGEAKIAAAGPLSNFFLAAVFGIFVRILSGTGANPILLEFLRIIVLQNIALGIFNFLPLPPLDGSKVLFAILPRTEGGYQIAAFLEQYGFVILLFMIFMGLGGVISPIIYWLYRIFVGAAF